MNIQFSNEIETKGFYVYSLTYQNGKPFYIGKGQNGRYKKHFKNGKTELKKFIRTKLKKQSLRVVIIRDNLTEEKAFKLEIKLIKKYGTRGDHTGVLYNLTKGGGGLSTVIYTKEIRNKMSNACKTNYWEGKKFSKEHREKLSESHKCLRPWQKGRKHTEESKDKMSKSLKGKNKGSNHPMYGKTHSKESRKKISDALKGRNMQEETRSKISKSLKTSS